MQTYLKCEPSKANESVVITARCRMAYAQGLTEAQLSEGETDPKKARYQVTLLFPKAADLALLNAAVEKCAVEKWGADYKKKEKVKKPFLKTEEYPKVGADAEAFPVMVRTSSPTRPNVVDATMQHVGDDRLSEIYSGRWCRVSVRPYAWSHKTGGNGVSLGLQNVQLLEHDEQIGGGRARAEDEFEAAEGVGGEGGSTDSLFG